jgi:hypothetical protein
MSDEWKDKRPLPQEYPVDERLLIEAETIASGADIHDRNKYRVGYKRAIEVYKKTPSHHQWHYCVDVERLLRGVIAEAKAGRNRGRRFDESSK